MSHPLYCHQRPSAQGIPRAYSGLQEGTNTSKNPNSRCYHQGPWCRLSLGTSSEHVMVRALCLGSAPAHEALLEHLHWNSGNFWARGQGAEGPLSRGWGDPRLSLGRTPPGHDLSVETVNFFSSLSFAHSFRGTVCPSQREGSEGWERESSRI